MKILVLCTGNSCRSQMAEGYLRNFLNDKASVYSAGLEKHGLNPLAIEVMQEDGIDISQHTSNLIEEYEHLAFDYVITVCDHAHEKCPIFPARVKRLHRDFIDPAKVAGSKEEKLPAFREVRDEIRDFTKKLAQQLA